MIQAEKLTYAIDECVLVDQVSLDLHPGEIVAVIGANGAGKSTFLKMLAGDLEPTAGTIRIDGQSLRDFSKMQIAGRRAILPQSSAVPFDFTALEIVQMGRLPHQSSLHDVALARDAMQRTGTSHLATRLVTTLSGGEMQRVHLARVLTQISHPPPSGGRYLLLDEPTSSLDPAHQHSTLRLAQSLAGEKVGVLVVLHDLNLAGQYAHRILLLQQGKCLALDTPPQVLTSELMAEAFALPMLVQTHPTGGFPVLLPAC